MTKHILLPTQIMYLIEKLRDKSIPFEQRDNYDSQLTDIMNEIGKAQNQYLREFNDKVDHKGPSTSGYRIAQRKEEKRKSRR